MKKWRDFKFLLFSLLLAILLNSFCVFDSSGIKLEFRIDKWYKPPHACQGAYYFFQFAACNGTLPYKWDLVMGTLPSGLKLGTDGDLKGKPSANGTYTFMVRAKDSSKPEQSYSEEFTITVSTFAITDPDSTLWYCPGELVDHTIQTCGGQGSLTWSLASGSLPSGINVTSSGHIYGITSDAGLFECTVQAADKSGKTAQKTYLLCGKEDISILSSSYLPAGQTGVAYTPVQLKACGGSGNYAWGKYGGDLPSDILLSSSGLLSGTPTKIGSFVAYLWAQDQNPPKHVGKKAFSITITAGTLSVSTNASLTPANECAWYSNSLQAKGGSGTYTWSLVSGSQLPAGLNLDATSGKISGYPSRPKSSPYSFTVEVNDGSTTASKALTLLVNEETTASADLVIPEVRHGSGAYDILHIWLAISSDVCVDFRFKTTGVLQQTVTKARLQCVGDCSTVSTTTISISADVNGDGQNERVAHFNGPLVLALVSAAGRKDGDTATLRIWIDMVVDGNSVTYVKRATVKVAQ